MVSFYFSAITALALLAATANASYELIAGYEPRSQVTDHVSNENNGMALFPVRVNRVKSFVESRVESRII